MTTAAPQHAYRPHLDGIRAVAVILVIVFHLGYGWAPGGFVGVDVFFVLSGYLITGLLVGELARSGRVDLARFYARRVRRLLPAAALVVGVVIVATAVLMDRADQAAVGQDATLSALYAANWRFALTEVDYFAPGDVYSPLIHFWSLGIEEQFYVFWPAMLLGLWAIARRVRRGARANGDGANDGGGRLLLGAVLVLAAISAALSVLLEPGPLTYYGTHTRAYQLLAGAALAIAALRMASRPEGPAAGAGASARLRNAGVATSAAAFAALLVLTHEIPNAREYPGLAGIAVTSRERRADRRPRPHGPPSAAAARRRAAAGRDRPPVVLAVPLALAGDRLHAAAGHPLRRGLPRHAPVDGRRDDGLRGAVVPAVGAPDALQAAHRRPGPPRRRRRARRVGRAEPREHPAAAALQRLRGARARGRQGPRAAGRLPVLRA